MKAGGKFPTQTLLICIDGRIYCFSKEGEMTVIEATDKLKVLGQHEFGQGIYATPAVSGGRMYVRTFGRLISIGGKG